MKTEFFVEYDLFDTTALEDSQIIARGNSTFANIDLIKDNISSPNYATLEHNFFVLDGSMEEFPPIPTSLAFTNFVFFSLEQAGPNGVFTNPPEIEINFSEYHSSIGLTLYFLESYPVEVEIFWYDFLNILQSKSKFYPDKLIYLCKNQVEEYGKVVIRFNKALPYHYIKLQYIEYGTKIVWGSDTIKSGKLINDTDPISDKIKTDKLNFDFIDTEDEFNIGNASGMHRLFQKRQRMLPYEVVGGKTIPLGVFFLDGNSNTKNVTKISAVDYKGMLTNVNFIDGLIYNGETAGNIIKEIMETSGIEEYQIDDETANTPLYGTIKIQTCQKALREVLFACGSEINTSRRAGIDIHKIERSIVSKIERETKFSTTLSTDHYVSDVNVKYQTWALEEKVSQLTKGIYGPGIHTIQFTSPAANATTNVGIITKHKPYYVILEIDSEEYQEVTISGQKYVSEELVVLSSVEHVKSGEVRSTKNFTGTLLNFELAQKAAERILEYYQLQQVIQTKHLSGAEKAGDWVEIDNPSHKHGNFLAALESVSTDLAGGFISTAKFRGYYKLTTEYYYSGDELITGEEAGIL